MIELLQGAGRGPAGQLFNIARDQRRNSFMSRSCFTVLRGAGP